MTTLHVHFPAGRYHATPGGQHVNEGQIEWPPSPWRIVRALIATGYTTQGWTAVPALAQQLFAKLAAAPPSYHLPPASVAHSRHYMPLGVLDKGREKTTLVFDAWADVSDGTLAIEWPVDLDDAETELLAVLSAAMGYLGRSESWVEIRLSKDAAPPPETRPAFPCDGTPHPGPGWEQVSLMAPEVSAAFMSWREQAVEEALAPFPLPDGSNKASKKVLSDRAKARAPFPETLLDALQWDTAQWKGHRWGQPPGSRRLLYWRSADALEVTPPVNTFVPAAPRVSTALLVLATATGNRSALPTIARTLPQAELIRRSLLSQVGDSPIPCPELTGRDHANEPLSGHQHSYILPLDLDGDGHIDHVLIHARIGLGAEAQRAMRALRRTWQKRGSDLHVAVAGGGNMEDLRRLPGELAEGVTRLLGPVGGASTWVSQTPFVPPRFLKPRGKNNLFSQIRRELENHGHPAAQVEVVPWDASNLHLRHAVRVRRGDAKGPPADCGFAVRLRFERPIEGPISLGYASHFGLGLFGAEVSSNQ